MLAEAQIIILDILDLFMLLIEYSYALATALIRITSN